MGYAFAMSPCLVCGRPFAYNPITVPSFFVEGVREPICEPCFRAVNAERERRGVARFPEPAADAWVACEESELPS